MSMYVLCLVIGFIVGAFVVGLGAFLKSDDKNPPLASEVHALADGREFHLAIYPTAVHFNVFCRAELIVSKERELNGMRRLVELVFEGSRWRSALGFIGHYEKLKGERDSYLNALREREQANHDHTPVSISKG